MKKLRENLCFLAKSQANFCRKVRINPDDCPLTRYLILQRILFTVSQLHFRMLAEIIGVLRGKLFRMNTNHFGEIMSVLASVRVPSLLNFLNFADLVSFVIPWIEFFCTLIP